MFEFTPSDAWKLRKRWAERTNRRPFDWLGTSAESVGACSSCGQQFVWMKEQTRHEARCFRCGAVGAFLRYGERRPEQLATGQVSRGEELLREIGRDELADATFGARH